MNTAAAQERREPLALMRRAPHPLGPSAVLLAVVALGIGVAAVSGLGAAADQAQALYGRTLAQIPADMRPPSVGVYTGVLAAAVLAQLTALVLGFVALVKFKCKLCGPVAVAVAVVAPIVIGVSFIAAMH